MKLNHYKISALMVLVASFAVAFPVCTSGFGSTGDSGTVFSGSCSDFCADDQVGVQAGGCSAAVAEGGKGHTCTDTPTDVTMHTRSVVKDIFNNCTSCSTDSTFTWTYYTPNNGGSCVG